jgi:DNA primase
MPKIERWIIDKLLDATSIVDVIGDFVDLRKTGVNYTGCCPFHEDHHDGNFIVRPEGL